MDDLTGLSFAGVHFLRPLWLLGLLALPLLAWLWRRRAARANAWQGKVDAHLLPHLLEAGSGTQARWGLRASLLGLGLALLALAGPAAAVPPPAVAARQVPRSL